MLFLLILVLVSNLAALQKGQTVCANWSGSKYFATITNVAGDAISVVYGDGDSATLKPEEILEIQWDPALKPGDKVYAIWNNSAKFYTGVVLETCQMSYKVKWDDGSAPSWVPATKILKM
jgi:hypothetical protein